MGQRRYTEDPFTSLLAPPLRQDVHHSRLYLRLRPWLFRGALSCWACGSLVIMVTFVFIAWTVLVSPPNPALSTTERMRAAPGHLMTLAGVSHTTQEPLPSKQEPKHIIDVLIEEHPIVIFSKSYCGFCRRVKHIFQEMGVHVYSYELDQASDGRELQEELAVRTGQRTVPNVFIGQKHIGGCDTIQELQKSGQLLSLLESCK